MNAKVIIQKLLNRFGHPQPATPPSYASATDTPPSTPKLKKPRGIFYLMPLASTVAPTLPAVPTPGTCAGFAGRATFAFLETSPGVFDFSYFDNLIAYAQENGLVVSLSVTAGYDSPADILALPSTLYLATNSGGTQFADVPVPWDATYHSRFAALLNALAVKYESNPTVVYISVSGMGNGVEDYFVYNQTDLGTFNAAGGLAAWLPAVESVSDVYGAAFPTTPWVLVLAEPITGCTPTDNASGDTALTSLINYTLAKYPASGLASHGLRPGYGTGEEISMEIQAASATHVTVYQMADPTTDLSGLAVGVSQGGVAIEVYASSFIPANQSILASTNAQLLAIP